MSDLTEYFRHHARTSLRLKDAQRKEAQANAIVTELLSRERSAWRDVCKEMDRLAAEAQAEAEAEREADGT